MRCTTGCRWSWLIPTRFQSERPDSYVTISAGISVISTATSRVVRFIPPGAADVDRRHPGRLPGLGGNGYTGSISVISTATNTVTDTISGGGQATALNAATIAIAFGPAGS